MFNFLAGQILWEQRDRLFELFADQFFKLWRIACWEQAAEDGVASEEGVESGWTQSAAVADGFDQQRGALGIGGLINCENEIVEFKLKVGVGDLPLKVMGDLFEQFGEHEFFEGLLT